MKPATPSVSQSLRALGWAAAIAVAATTTLAAGGGRAAPVLPAPRIFQPGVISGPANDGAPTFSPDGRLLLLSVSNNAWSTVLISELRQGRWSRPHLAPFSGPGSDQQPAMSPDGRYVVYASSRSALQPDGSRRTITNLWRVDRSPSGWSAPVRLPAEVNISERMFKPSIAANGDMFFMSSDGPGAPKWRLYRSARVDGVYQRATPLPFSDGAHPDVDPYIAPDQSYIIFSSKGRRGPPDDDHEHLYLCLRRGEVWGPVTPLRYAGGDQGVDDGEAQVDPTGATLYFTSGRAAAVEGIRGLPQIRRDLARLQTWDNGNNNVWTLPLAPFLAAARLATPG